MYIECYERKYDEWDVTFTLNLRILELKRALQAIKLTPSSVQKSHRDACKASLWTHPETSSIDYSTVTKSFWSSNQNLLSNNWIPLFCVLLAGIIENSLDHFPSVYFLLCIFLFLKLHFLWPSHPCCTSLKLFLFEVFLKHSDANWDLTGAELSGIITACDLETILLWCMQPKIAFTNFCCHSILLTHILN